ncbi:MAG: hypothetical protein O3A59_13480 [Nitrospirae bacterium]|nr:hypothetical protein [Nitrospirota bacterium]
MNKPRRSSSEDLAWVLGKFLVHICSSRAERGVVHIGDSPRLVFECVLLLVEI